VRFGLRFAALCVVAVAGTALGIVFGVGSGSHAAKKQAHVAVAGACTRTAARSLASVTTPSDTLAFVRYDRGSYAIFVMSASGGPARRLSAAPPHALPPQRELFQDSPSWSPDGTRIAFGSNRDGHYGIYVMRADGTQSRRIVLSKPGDAAPSWSPDGRRIVFSRGADGLYVMNADGRQVRRLTHVQFTKDLDPAWSPDGTRIAFVRREAGIGASLFAIRPDGTGLCELTPFAASTASPAWSPDGAMLVYSAGEGSGFGISVVRADGTGRHRLTPQALDFDPVWSPDGSRIAFQREATLYVMNADGSHVRRLTARAAIDGGPAWRPAT
jgi:Tol biopolymer transport system component